MQVKTHAIGCVKSDSGRRPGMKAKMVQSERPGHFVNMHPGIDVSRRIACFGEYGAFQCAAKKGELAIDGELRALCFEFPHPKLHRFFISGSSCCS